jgi:ATP-dependent Lhr-like helicase
VRQIISLLQGFELPAGSWELDILPARIADYEPEWLDELFHSGETIWGRLEGPAKCVEGSLSGRILTRVMPISLMRRADLAWLLPSPRDDGLNGARGDAQAVDEALSAHGALFFDDLLAVTQLLPAQLEQALGELAALGVVTADSMAAIRTSVSRRNGVPRRRSLARGNPSRSRSLQGGRWSKFPPFTLPVDARERATRWAWQLLDRYGIVFRDLLARETAAPSWHELAPIYRRLEARGEIRGGRFVAGVGGEQFALADAVTQLREVRDAPADEIWQVLSAADPINLVGIITQGMRVPATRNNRVLFRNGRPIAARESTVIRWLCELDEAAQRQATHLLRRPDGPHRVVHVGEQPVAATSY